MTLHIKASMERWPVDGHFTIARGAKHLLQEFHNLVHCHGNSSIEIEPSMLASFTSVDCESQNRDNGNPLRFNPPKKRSSAII
jgi:hypothetical protein